MSQSFIPALFTAAFGPPTLSLREYHMNHTLSYIIRCILPGTMITSYSLIMQRSFMPRMLATRPFPLQKRKMFRRSCMSLACHLALQNFIMVEGDHNTSRSKFFMDSVFNFLLQYLAGTMRFTIACCCVLCVCVLCECVGVGRNQGREQSEEIAVLDYYG